MSRVARPTLAAWLVALLLAAAAPRAGAHALSYSWADVDWGARRIEVRLSLHRDDAAAALGVAVPESLMRAEVLAREAAPLARLVDARFAVRASGHALPLKLERLVPDPSRHAVVLTLAAALAAPLARIEVDERLVPGNPQHECFLAVSVDGRLLRQEVLTAERPSAVVYARGGAGRLAVLAEFVEAGVRHIFQGPDHILFIVGLLLLGGGVRRVLGIATAFTLAHSLTLALAALDIVRIPGRIVEPLIALSIVCVGIENLRHREGAPDRRAPLAFGFGLVHGFGFASVLATVGLPREALGWSLFGFNAGVELGQAAIVLAVVPLLGLLRARVPAIGRRTLLAGSWGIIAAGGFWLVQRLITGG
jgi:hydrogenase/urease accessory protein HupE